MRFRITIRHDSPRVELRGYFDVVGGDPAPLQRFAAAVEPWGLVIASVEADDYDPFTDSA